MPNRKINPEDKLVDFAVKVEKDTKSGYGPLPLARRRYILRKLRKLAKTLVNKERERALTPPE